MSTLGNEDLVIQGHRPSVILAEGISTPTRNATTVCESSTSRYHLTNIIGRKAIAGTARSTTKQ